MKRSPSSNYCPMSQQRGLGVRATGATEARLQKGEEENPKKKKTTRRKAPRKGTERERKSPGKPRSSCAQEEDPHSPPPCCQTSHRMHTPACTGAAVPASISPIYVSEQLDFMREENKRNKVNQNNHNQDVRRATLGHTSSGGSLRGVK